MQTYTSLRASIQIHTELKQHSINKTNDSVLKWAQGLNRHLSKEYIQMASCERKIFSLINHHRSSSQSTVGHHSTLVGRVSSKYIKLQFLAEGARAVFSTCGSRHLWEGQTILSQGLHIRYPTCHIFTL